MKIGVIQASSQYGKISFYLILYVDMQKNIVLLILAVLLTSAKNILI